MPEAADETSDVAAASDTPVEEVVEVEEEVLEEVVEEVVVEVEPDTEGDAEASPQAASVEEDIELGNGVGGDVVEATGDGIKLDKVGLYGEALEAQRRVKGLSVLCACVCIAALAVGLPHFIPFVLDLPTIIEEN